MRLVVAIGGNAIQPGDDQGTIQQQRATIREACEELSALVARGVDIVLTHGNGPQVGRLMYQDEALPSRFPRYPLDVHVAETQGQLGYLLQSELGAALRRARSERCVATIVTQIEVEASDPAFLRPTKPVGPVFDDAYAAELRARGEPVVAVAGGGWRRAVPSPIPQRIVEEDAVRALLDAGIVPIAAGGGGIPVVREGNAHRGIAAVVDKDLAAATLLRAIRGDALVIVTNVDRVQRGYGTPRARPIERMTVREAREGVVAGEFPMGTMGPKVLAAAHAAEAGARAIITSLARIVDALEGRDGTEVVA